jgi:hypothetical protein
LLRDREIVETALSTTPQALFFVGSQRLHVDLVVRAIQQANESELSELFEYIHGDMWSFKEVALAWLQRGQRWLDEYFPIEFEFDPDLCLAVAQYNWSEFWYTHTELCQDKQFMLQAVERDGRVLLDAEGDLARDFDLALVAFAGSEGLPGLYNLNKHEDLCFLMEFSQHVRRQIAQHQVFVQLILCSIFGDPGPHCKFPVLNQGNETTAVYLHRLADYMDIPSGKTIRLLRSASRNLSRWGY